MADQFIQADLAQVNTVVFRMPMPLEAGEPQQGAITFTRDPAFRGNPTPLTYSVFDKQGIESNVGSLVITSFLTQVTTAVTALNALDDATFWAAYRFQVINADHGALNAPAD